MKLRINESKYNLDWKEIGTETIYIGAERYRLPIYEKCLYNTIVIQVVPEENENEELVWTVYYTPEIGKAGFKLAETGFFDSKEAIDYVDNELVEKFDIFDINKNLDINESNDITNNSSLVKSSCVKMCKIYKSVLEELTK